jgi:hypothetical protein
LSGTTLTAGSHHALHGAAALLLSVGLGLGSVSIFTAHPLFALGVWRDAEPMGLVFYAAAALCFAGLALLCLQGDAVLRGLNHPAVLAPAALGLWSLAAAPFTSFPMLSVFGPAQSSLGALWYLAFAAFVAAAITLRRDRYLFAGLTVIAASTAVVAAGFNLWRIDWPEAVRDRLMWLWRTTLLEFNEYQAYYALALAPLAFVMLRRHRRLAAQCLLAVVAVSLLASRNRVAMVAIAAPFALLMLPEKWLSWTARLRPRRDVLAIAAIASIAALSYAVLRLLDFRSIAPTLWSRRLLLEGVEPSLLDSPAAIVLGHGWGRYADYLVGNIPLAGVRIFNPDWAGLDRDLFHSHHAFFEGLFAAGLPGLLLAVAIPMAIVLGSQRRWRSIAIAFALAWVVIDCFWFMMPATLPVLALACGTLAESATSVRARWTRGPWAIGLLAVLAIAAVGIVDLHANARNMSLVIDCLTAGRASAACETVEVAADPRGANQGLASVVGDTIPTLLRSAQPLPDRQLRLVRSVLAEAERRDMAGASPLLALELANTYAAIAFMEGGERVLGSSALLNSWTRVLHDVLRQSPQRVDVLATYFSWLLVGGRHDDVRAMLDVARRVDPDHPIVLWFSGIEDLKPGDVAQRDKAFGRMRRAIERGLERFMPVDASIKARLTAAEPAK